MNRPRILLADDHLMMREKVTRMLESEFDIIGAVTDGEALLKEASRAATTLAESGHFRRTHGRCSACREPGDVTWSTQSRAVDLSARR